MECLGSMPSAMTRRSRSPVPLMSSALTLTVKTADRLDAEVAHLVSDALDGMPAGTAGSERLARDGASWELNPVRLGVLAGYYPQSVEALVPDLGRSQGADARMRVGVQDDDQLVLGGLNGGREHVENVSLVRLASAFRLKTGADLRAGEHRADKDVLQVSSVSACGRAGRASVASATVITSASAPELDRQSGHRAGRVRLAGRGVVVDPPVVLDPADDRFA